VTFVVVPNSLSSAINQKLDEALVGFPDISEEDRDQLYRQLLSEFDERGLVPDFSIEKNE
jgi:hypothetical protein